jgi:hypothetical protein
MSTLTAERSFPDNGDRQDVGVVPDDTSSASLVELLLKEPDRLDDLLREPLRQREAVPRLLALALAGFAIYGIAASVILNLLLEMRQYWPTGVPAANWSDRSAANLLAAYCLGLVAANGVCLPSFYFFGLLAGVQTTMLGVTANAMKGLAASALALVGIRRSTSRWRWPPSSFRCRTGCWPPLARWAWHCPSSRACGACVRSTGASFAWPIRSPRSGAAIGAVSCGDCWWRGVVVTRRSRR